MKDDAKAALQCKLRPLRHALAVMRLESGTSALPAPFLSDGLMARLGDVIAALRAAGAGLPEAA